MTIKDYFKVSPRVLPVGKPAKITVEPRYEFLKFKGLHKVCIWPSYYFDAIAPGEAYPAIEIEATDGKLLFEYDFGVEQEYFIQVTVAGPKGMQLQLETSVYAVKDDLLGRFPYKGDLHMHTTASDGLEDDRHRIAMARKAGFDFIALTDHNNYDASAQTIKLIQKLRLPILVLRGEEVQAPGCHVHILSIDADYSIINDINKDLKSFQAEVDKLEKNNTDTLLTGRNRLESSIAQGVFARIKKANGLSVFCHPFWKALQPQIGARLDIPLDIAEELFRKRNFDVFELVSGAPICEANSNNLQTLFFAQHQGYSNEIPLIGISDAHTSNIEDASVFGINYTIAFCKELSPVGVREAIMNRYVVAVENAPINSPRCYGDLRIVRFAQFAIEEYFRFHKEDAAAEGQLMLHMAAGDLSCLDTLHVVAKQNRAVLEAEWKSKKLD